MTYVHQFCLNFVVILCLLLSEVIGFCLPIKQYRNGVHVGSGHTNGDYTFMGTSAIWVTSSCPVWFQGAWLWFQLQLYEHAQCFTFNPKLKIAAGAAVMAHQRESEYEPNKSTGAMDQWYGHAHESDRDGGTVSHLPSGGCILRCEKS
jgi:hypothetical protein